MSERKFSSLFFSASSPSSTRDAHALGAPSPDGEHRLRDWGTFQASKEYRPQPNTNPPTPPPSRNQTENIRLSKTQ